MNRAEEAFRQKAEESLGLAVSMFTLTSEDGGDADERFGIARSLVTEHSDPRIAGNALSFVCRLLSRYMTPAEVLAAKNDLIERTIGSGNV